MKALPKKNGQSIRKGSMGAALLNAEIIESPKTTADEKQAAMQMLKELAPALKALGLTRFLTWKNPEIQAVFDQVQ